MESKTIQELELFALNIRRETVKQIAELGSGHIGGCMSVIDLLAVLYGGVMNIDPKRPDWPQRDRLVMSKGHAGPSVYSVLALKGYIPMDWLLTLNKPGTNLPSHCDRKKTPGVDYTTGSLGQGLSAAAGIALGSRMNGWGNRVYCVLGDGECNEGQVWESALFAAQWKLDNLIAFVDYNHQMMDGRTDDLCNLGNLRRKFDEFGWYALDVDGHDIGQMLSAIQIAKQQIGRPAMIVLSTIKAKGLKKYEGVKNNHHAAISKHELHEYLTDFDQVERVIMEGGSGYVV